ncbi:MAG: hypothetical protein LBM73_01175 [Candidatus Nomurabacteria bacterium]|jgi:hypothetical protein|nr:hypothetical protein [Candidatus Nomurabacteria bacterium]
MAKTKIWFKRRTTRGRGRPATGKSRPTPRHIEREFVKNQRWYSHFILKFVLFALLGLVWFRLGVAKIGDRAFGTLPLGLAVGLILVCFEKFRIGRGVELIILLIAGLTSYFLPIGIVI